LGHFIFNFFPAFNYVNYFSINKFVKITSVESAPSSPWGTVPQPSVAAAFFRRRRQGSSGEARAAVTRATEYGSGASSYMSAEHLRRFWSGVTSHDGRSGRWR
jgi:hypothetical protein